MRFFYWRGGTVKRYAFDVPPPSACESVRSALPAGVLKPRGRALGDKFILALWLMWPGNSS